MRVLLSAYACEPRRGSEAEVGFRVLLAAAGHHEVWVLTRANNLPGIEDALASQDLVPDVHLPDVHLPDVHLIGLDLGRAARGVKKRFGRVGLNLYYIAWQRAARRTARQLHREIGFDLVHHVTFANFARPVGAWLPGVPLLWGPVGGGVRPPPTLIRELGVMGWAEEVLRSLAQLGSRRTVKQVGGPLTLALAQNAETAARLRPGITTEVLPNALAAVDGFPPSFEPVDRRSNDVVVVGQLRPLKGGSLAIRAFAQSRAEGRLVFFGSGRDQRRLHRLAQRLGIERRVSFMGAVDRRLLLEEVRRAGALLMPSLRDEAPLTVAEALALGTPAIVLDHGGPAAVSSFWDPGLTFRVPVGDRDATTASMAEAIDAALAAKAAVATVPHAPSVSFAAAINNAYTRLAQASSDRTPRAT